MIAQILDEMRHFLFYTMKTVNVIDTRFFLFSEEVQIHEKKSDKILC